jgi:hypothetical protein
MNVQKHYRGFALTWQDPPETGEGYQLSISSEDLDLRGSGTSASREACAQRCAARSAAVYRWRAIAAEGRHTLNRDHGMTGL